LRQPEAVAWGESILRQYEGLSSGFRSEFSQVRLVRAMFQLVRFADTKNPVFSQDKPGCTASRSSRRTKCPFELAVGPLTSITAAFLILCHILILASLPVCAETVHKVYFKGDDSHLDVYFIKGANPGPTLLLMGGIQGDEPGGYLAADLYADAALKKGNLIVVPRANFLSIVQNSRGLHGDMNRKFALAPNPTDREMMLVGIIKDLMKKSDFFLNLHDGSGYYAPVWESSMRNPLRFGQSIIADAAEHVKPDGQVLRMENIVGNVLKKVNDQVTDPAHRFCFNNHMTLSENSRHKEQRFSATFHALTKVGIPAFGIETSKNIENYRLRVRYQTMVINAFLEEVGIELETPKIYLETPDLRFLVISVNNRTPIVVKGKDVLKVEQGDVVRIVHVEANYPRGLTARFKGQTSRMDDVGQRVKITGNTVIEVRKDRFLMAGIPVEISQSRARAVQRKDVQPRVNYFCVRVNDKAVVVETGERLTVMKGDLITIMEPGTNLDPDDQHAMKVDLRGFRSDSASDPDDDRGHCIDTSLDLQEKFGRVDGGARLFPLQAKLHNEIVGESFIAVTEPKLEYLVLKRSEGLPFVAYAGDRLELPGSGMVTIVDMKTNAPETAPLVIKMAGRTFTWGQAGLAAIDSSRLAEAEIPLDITRNGRSIGKIWLKRGVAFRLTGGAPQPSLPVLKVRY
jgi:hypothetical protein